MKTVPPGVTLTDRGAYSAATAYQWGDVVTRQGASYFAKPGGAPASTTAPVQVGRTSVGYGIGGNIAFASGAAAGDIAVFITADRASAPTLSSGGTPTALGGSPQGSGPSFGLWTKTLTSADVAGTWTVGSSASCQCRVFRNVVLPTNVDTTIALTSTQPVAAPRAYASNDLLLVASRPSAGAAATPANATTALDAADQYPGTNNTYRVASFYQSGADPHVGYSGTLPPYNAVVILTSTGGDGFDSTKWSVLAAAGASGTAGVAGRGYTDRGAYSTSSSYAVDDLFQFNGSTYRVTAPIAATTTAPLFVGSSKLELAITTSGGNVPLPTGSVAGDTLILAMGGRYVTPTTPAGFTTIGTTVAGSGGSPNNLATYYKALTAGDISAGSIAVTWSSNGAQIAFARTYRNVDPTALTFSERNVGAVGAGVTMTADAITPGAYPAKVVQFLWFDDDVNTTAASQTTLTGGSNQQQSSGTAVYVRMLSADQDVTSGVSATVSATDVSASYGIVKTISLPTSSPAVTLPTNAVLWAAKGATGAAAGPYLTLVANDEFANLAGFTDTADGGASTGSVSVSGGRATISGGVSGQYGRRLIRTPAVAMGDGEVSAMVSFPAGTTGWQVGLVAKYIDANNYLWGQFFCPSANQIAVQVIKTDGGTVTVFSGSSQVAFDLTDITKAWIRLSVMGNVMRTEGWCDRPPGFPRGSGGYAVADHLAQAAIPAKFGNGITGNVGIRLSPATDAAATVSAYDHFNALAYPS